MTREQFETKLTALLEEAGIDTWILAAEFNSDDGGPETVMAGCGNAMWQINACIYLAKSVAQCVGGRGMHEDADITRGHCQVTEEPEGEQSDGE